MSSLPAHAREQPQASTSASPPVPTPQNTGPSTFLPPNQSEMRDDRLNTIADTKAVALELFHTVTTAAADVAGSTSVPGLQIGLLALATVIEKIQAMQANVEGVATLRERVGSLIASLNEFRDRFRDQPLPKGMVVRIEGLVACWTDIGKRAAKIKSRGRVLRFLRSSRDAKKLSDLVGEINESIQDKIMMQGILNIESYMLDIYNALKEIKTHLEASFIPTYAKNAPYDSNDARNECLMGTRVDILQQICRWVIAACAYGESIPKDGIIFWINGLGGTGKTTIAYSIAKWCKELKLLGGSFFCSRSDKDCSNPNLIFLTLCRQLSHRHAGFKEKVEAILRENPDIGDYGPYRQFEELILRPLKELGKAFPRLVIVLDALDECQDKNATSTILSVIAKYAAAITPYLLFVITSRPEQHITALFDASREDSLNDTTTPLLLHEVSLKVVIEDIKRYVNHEFNSYIGVLGVKKGWPSADEKNKLALLSRGLFIYVATAIRFIMNKDHANPRGRLRLLLNMNAQPDTSASYEFLFSLYSTILVASCEKASPKLVAAIRNVLGTVILVQESLSPAAVSSLLGIAEDDVRNALTRLHSVLYVPINSRQPIRIIHPTFVEFMLQSSAGSSPESSSLVSIVSTIALQPAEQHWHLFVRSIEVMSCTLKRDMINIRYPVMFRSEIEQLKARVEGAIEPHVSYACRFWGDHLRYGIDGVAMSDALILLRDFIHRTLLYWLEASSLLDAMDKAILVLETARNVCQTRDRSDDLAVLLADFHRFVVAYSSCIHAAPMQIYYCTLSIVPTTSLVGSTYAHERKHALVVEYGSPNSWAPCLDAVPGHGGNVAFTIAFSHDGSYFATAGRDMKATVWKTATRTPIVSFDGHTGAVNCVAYAPDGLHVASGSYDRRVCVWQPSSGECVHTLTGHTDLVVSVAYSGDGRRIVSATDEGEVKLWDTTDGRCLLTLGRTGNFTLQVGISPDAGVIARGEGASLSLYDVESATSEALEFPDTVWACVFSPDGRHIAARSKRVIQVWACADKSLVRSIDVAEDLTSRLAFSPDGTLIGCGSEDGSVRLWPVASEDSPHTLQGHTGWVHDLAYSPDKSQAISVAEDSMIRVWDLASSSTLTQKQPALKPPPPAPGPPRFALIQSGEHAIALLDLPALGIDTEHFPIDAEMPDDAPTATLFSDVVSVWHAALQAAGKWDWYGSAAAREWELLTGQWHSQLSERPLAISLDSTLMAYLSPTSDSVVNVCNLRTGTVIATLTGHTEKVRSIAFSPDTTRIATGSDDRSVKVWDTTTGAVLCEHTEHGEGRSTRAVAFSPDGCLVASGSNDKTVRIFEVATERVTRVFDSHRSFVAQVMFATDNIHLVALDHAHWVYVYDITTGVRTHEFSLKDDRWLRSPIFSSDGTGITVREDHGVSRSVSLWNPGRRTWPVYWITQDGWVYAMRPGKTHRLCWLPPEWRKPLASYEGTLCIREAKSELYKEGRVIVLNMTQLVEYVDSLDAEQQ